MRVIAAALVLGFAATALIGIASTNAASTTATTVVTAEVLSATNLDVATACATGVADVTDFGQLLPGTDNVTGTDCTVEFGSSNDTSMLRAYQRDRIGTAMVRFADGDLDLSWGTNGIQRHDLGGNEGISYDSGTGPLGFAGGGMVVQPDGKVVASGHKDGDWLVARFNADGSLDTAGFNSPTGYTTISAVASANERAQSVALAADGDILVTGEFDCQVGVARLTSAGAADPAFNGGSPVRTDLAGACERGAQIMEQSTGRIVISGGAAAGHALVGYTAAGVVDTTFSAPDGISIAEWTADDATAAIDTQDRIVFATYEVCGCDPDVMRITPDATGLDPTFNGGSAVTMPRAQFDAGALTAYSMGIHVDDLTDDLTISVTVGMGALNGDIGVARITSAGALDATFAGDGSVVFDPPVGEDSAPVAPVVDAAGQVVVPINITSNDIYRRMGVVRFTSTGVLDTDFGDGAGWIEVDPPGSMFGGSGVGGLVVDPQDGSYWLGGASNNGADYDVLLAKLGGSSVADFSDDPADLAGDDWGTPGAAFFGACMLGATNGTETGSTWVIDVNAGSDCLDGDADPWEAIDADGTGPSAKVLESDSSGQTTAQAHLRFGFRTATNQPPGIYSAPVTFEAVAPNV